MSTFDDVVLLVMVPEDQNGAINRTTEYVDWPETEPVSEPEYVPDTFIINRIRKELKMEDPILFLYFQYLIKPIQEEEGQRPFIPRLALWVDGNSGMIMDNQFFSPDDLWKSFQNNLLEVFTQLGEIPHTIGVNSEMALYLLDKISDELHIDVVYAPDHPLFGELK